MNSIAQNSNIIPQRVEADHYQVQSFTESSKTYDLTFNYEKKMWVCNCPNAVIKHNNNCKHVILLKSYIHKKKQEQAPEAIQQHSTSVELVNVLSRIAKLENDSDQIKALQDKLVTQEYQLDQQQKQLDYQRELIAALQTSVCKLNERTINQDVQIQKLVQAQDQLAQFTQEMHLQQQTYQRTLEDQAQQIDALHEQISSQQKASEQVVRVVIEQSAPAPRQTREAAPEEMTIKPIKDESGKVIACKINKFTVEVVGNCAAGCDCSLGKVGRQCGHMIDVDKFLSK